MSEQEQIALHEELMIDCRKNALSRDTQRVENYSDEDTPQNSVQGTFNQKPLPIYLLQHQNLDLRDISPSFTPLQQKVQQMPNIQFDKGYNGRNNNSNLQNKQKGYATQRIGERWNIGKAQRSPRAQKQKESSQLRQNNMTTKNQTVTNFSLFSHRQSAKKTFGMKPSCRDYLDQDEFEYLHSLQEVRGMSKVDENFAKGAHIRPMIFQRKTVAEPKHILIKQEKKDYDRPVTNVPLALRRPGSALGSKYNRKHISTVPTKPVALGLNQEGRNRRLPQKPQLPFRQQERPRRFSCAEVEGCRIEALKQIKARRQTGFSVPPDLGELSIGDHETIGNFPDRNLNSTLGSELFGQRSFSPTDALDGGNSIISALGDSLAQGSCLNQTQPLEMEKRKPTRIQMERAFAKLRVEQMRKAANDVKKKDVKLPINLPGKMSIRDASQFSSGQTPQAAQLSTNIDIGMEMFKRNHLRKITNSFIPYKLPFDKQRSYSVWNGRELPRGGLPTIVKQETIKDSLYESQPSEKGMINSGSSGKEGMEYESDQDSIQSVKDDAKCGSKKSKAQKSKDKQSIVPQPGSQGAFNAPTFDQLILSMSPSQSSKQASPVNKSIRSNEMCELSARGSSMPLNKLATHSSGQKKQKKYELVVSTDSINPKLVVVSNIPNNTSASATPQKNPASLQTAVTITTGIVRGMDSKTSKALEVKSPQVSSAGAVGNGFKNIAKKEILNMQSSDSSRKEMRKQKIKADKKPLKLDISGSKKQVTEIEKIVKPKPKQKKVEIQPAVKIPQPKNTTNVPTRHSPGVTTINLGPGDSQVSNYKQNPGVRAEMQSPFQAKNKQEANSLVGSRRESVTDKTVLMAFSPAPDSDLPSLIQEKVVTLNIQDTKKAVNGSALQARKAEEKMTILSETDGVQSNQDSEHKKQLPKKILNPDEVNTGLTQISPPNLISLLPNIKDNNRLTSEASDFSPQALKIDQLAQEDTHKYIELITVPIMQQQLQVDSTMPVYTDRSFKQGKSLKNSTYSQNYKRDTERRQIVNLEKNEDQTRSISPSLQSQGNDTQRQKSSSPKADNSIDQSLMIKRANLTRQDINRSKVQSSNQPALSVNTAITNPVPVPIPIQYTKNEDSPSATPTIQESSKMTSEHQRMRQNSTMRGEFGMQSQESPDFKVVEPFQPSEHFQQNIIQELSQNVEKIQMAKVVKQPKETQEQPLSSLVNKGQTTPKLINREMNFSTIKTDQQTNKMKKRQEQIHMNLVKQSPNAENRDIQEHLNISKPNSRQSISIQRNNGEPASPISPFLNSPISTKQEKRTNLPEAKIERPGFKGASPIQKNQQHFANKTKKKNKKEVAQFEPPVSPLAQEQVTTTQDYMCIDAKQLSLSLKQQKNISAGVQATSQRSRDNVPATVHYHKAIVDSIKPITLSVGSQRSSESQNYDTNYMPATIDATQMDGAAAIIVMKNNTNILELNQEPEMIPQAFQTGGFKQRNSPDELMPKPGNTQNQFAGKTQQIKKRQYIQNVQTSLGETPSRRLDTEQGMLIQRVNMATPQSPTRKVLTKKTKGQTTILVVKSHEKDQYSQVTSRNQAASFDQAYTQVDVSQNVSEMNTEENKRHQVSTRMVQMTNQGLSGHQTPTRQNQNDISIENQDLSTLSRKFDQDPSTLSRKENRVGSNIGTPRSCI